MTRLVSNAKPYPLDSPAVLSPGETVKVEDSPEVQALIDAGVLVEQTEPAAEPKRSSRKTEDTK